MCEGHHPVLCLQILDEAQFPRQHQGPNLSVTEWTPQQVARWLIGLHLELHVPEFTAKNVDGERLLQMESNELKVSGPLPQSCRLNYKKRSGKGF
jgi:neurabin